MKARAYQPSSRTWLLYLVRLLTEDRVPCLLVPCTAFPHTPYIVTADDITPPSGCRDALWPTGQAPEDLAADVVGSLRGNPRLVAKCCGIGGWTTARTAELLG